MAWINEIYDTLYDKDTICVACISYGKDSLAMLRSIKLLGLPLHRVVHTEVWATQTISADLPPMVEFKKKADKIIKELYGIEVEHICAMKNSQLVNGANILNMTEKLTYEDIFYRRYKEGRKEGAPSVYGFATHHNIYCRGELKNIRLSDTTRELVSVKPQATHTDFQSQSAGQWCQQLKLFSERPKNEGQKINIIQYLGIAPDEPLRVAKHIGRKDVILPLVEIGWEEGLCGLISKYQDLLSPTYTTSMRGGCWFCHNQSVGQLRLLRKNYPDLWQLLLKWDKDSPVTFHADGRTVHDFDRRFAMEDLGLVPTDSTFRWAMLDSDYQQFRILF